MFLRHFACVVDYINFDAGTKSAETKFVNFGQN